MYYPPPHKPLNREDAVAWRQLQNNSFSCLYILHLFHPAQYPSYCLYCGANPTVYHCTWECPQPQGYRPIPSPSHSSWETALTSSEPQEQRRLIQRARGVARPNGALN
uniref:Tick transposon n=1 Tax=Rhipicephalus pulchellus TaxID=72859 RepID=L7M1Z5_RHIPC